MSGAYERLASTQRVSDSGFAGEYISRDEQRTSLLYGDNCYLLAS